MLSHTKILPCIDLNSADMIWEWYPISDELVLSQSARVWISTFIKLPDTDVLNMRTYLALLTPQMETHLRESRTGALSGATGAFAETSYTLLGTAVRERILVIERDVANWATRVIGHLEHLNACTIKAPLAQEDKTAYGLMQCSYTHNTISLDANCSSLLGYTDGHPHTLSLNEWRERVHPDDIKEPTAAFHPQQEGCPQPDTLEDIVRIRNEQGEYIRVLCLFSVTQRGPDGQARHLAGTLQRLDALYMPTPQVHEDSQRLLFALNAAGDGLWDWDATTDTVYFSPSYLAMLGYTADEFSNDLETWKKKIHPDDREKITAPQRALVESPEYGDTFECTYRLMRANGEWAWILGRGYVTHRDASGRATRLVGLHTDITTTQTDRERLEELVKNDALTGLRSRTFCDREMERIERDAERPVSIIACDINGLKLVNDYMGHSVGDTLLVKVAQYLRAHLRAADCVARMGGDEFVIVLPCCPEKRGRKILSQIEASLDRHNAYPGVMPLLVAFGLAATESPDVSLAMLLAQADREMLAAKNRCRPAVRESIKAWIEQNTDRVVSLEDSRY